MRPHVVHVVHWLRLAGLENGVVNLIRCLHDRFRHTVICIADTGVLAARLPPEVRVIDFSTVVAREFLLFRLVRVFRELRPDIVHSRNWGTIDSVLAAWLAGVPVRIHGEHGRTAVDPGGQNRRRKIIRRLVSPLVSRFVTVSDDLREWLISDVGIAADKVICIHNGVDVARFAGGQFGLGRRSADLSHNDLVVGAVGRLDPVKDHRTLLEAFARIRGRRPQWRLTIIGEGELRAQLEARAAKADLKGAVDLLGERSDVPEALRDLNIFVISSIAEGLSNTVLEAMATGLPIVATRTGGNPELVEDGVNGMLVPVGDVDALAIALSTYLHDPALAARHGGASRRRAVERFSLERMALDYEKLYLSLLDKPNRH